MNQSFLEAELIYRVGVSLPWSVMGATKLRNFEKNAKCSRSRRRRHPFSTIRFEGKTSSYEKRCGYSIKFSFQYFFSRLHATL